MAVVISTSRAVNAVPELLGRLGSAGHDVRVVDEAGLDEQGMQALAGPAGALIVGVEPVTRGVLAAAPALRIVARPGVGYDAIDVAAATDAGVWVTITPGANTESVADHTMALILSLLRRVGELDAEVHAGRWPRSIGVELSGQVMGLIGLGAIGRAVAHRAQAFGMIVVAADPAADTSFAASHNIELMTVDELAASSDVVSLHAPSSDETRHMIDARLLRLMRPDAVLINTARGDLVDESALADAVASGVIQGAAVDVLSSEPPTSSPLLGVSGVIVTPHVAAYTRQALDRMAEAAVESVLAALAGDMPSGALNDPRPSTQTHAKETT